MQSTLAIVSKVYSRQIREFAVPLWPLVFSSYTGYSIRLRSGPYTSKQIIHHKTSFLSRRVFGVPITIFDILTIKFLKNRHFEKKNNFHWTFFQQKIDLTACTVVQSVVLAMGLVNGRGQFSILQLLDPSNRFSSNVRRITNSRTQPAYKLSGRYVA